VNDEAPARTSAKGEVASRELGKAEQAMARRMAESKATIPHLYLEAVADMRAALALREGPADPKPTVNDLVIWACARALRALPLANGAYRDGRVESYSRINVGFAVAVADSFVVPTIFDADTRSPSDIAAESRGLAGRARDGSITAPETSGATFTISNLGMHGITRFQPVIIPGQAAILGIGAVLIGDGDSRPMSLTLACDHRIVNGEPVPV